VEQKETFVRATDNRYASEREKFDLVIRLIRHEARTGTIRLLTGFSEDRIRKIFSTYFSPGPEAIRRRRGKTPSQVTPFVNSARRQGEASLLAGLFLRSGAALLDAQGRLIRDAGLANVHFGGHLCTAFEAYQALHPAPQFSFEWSWNLYRSLVMRRELRLAHCAQCEVAYVEDAYALSLARCPYCEIKDQPVALARPAGWRAGVAPGRLPA
jgi:hypothetical protein